MAQSLPVVRQLYLPGLYPQILAVGVLALSLHLVVKDMGWNHSVLFRAVIYWVFCRIMRALFTRHHAAGMAAYHARKFEEAVAHNQASYEFFSRHPWMDRWRFLMFGTASPNPYRTIALCNMALSEGQLGRGGRAIKLYEQALELTPDCANAEANLNMLRAGQAPDGAST